MKKNPLSQLTIRSAVVRSHDVGNIIACDLNKEKEDIAHSFIFKWRPGNFLKSEANFDAHSVCFITIPENALVFIASPGEYGVHYKGGATAGDILVNSHPKPTVARYGGFRSVSEISGQAYAVGFGGMVYRLDQLDLWTRIDDGLPNHFEIEAIHGFNSYDIYTVGDDGELWHYNGKKWSKHDLPTNLNLNALKCAGDEKVYLVGQDGILIRGRDDAWEIINHEETTDDIWGVEWFEGELFISSMSNVYRVNGEQLIAVDFGNDWPKTCYKLSSAKGVMWSIGEYDVMSFDGNMWKRIV